MHERDIGDVPAAAEAMLAAHRATPPGPEADRRLLSAVGLLALAGDARAALRHVGSVTELPVTGMRIAVQARLAWLTGHLDEAVDLGQRAWARSDLPEADRDLVAALIAQIEIVRDHADDGVTWATRALADGRLPPAVASHTRKERILALAVGGAYAEAWAALADLPEDPSEVELARHPELLMRGQLATWEGPLAAAQRDLSVVADLTHGDMKPYRLEASANLALSMFRDGRWDQSQTTLHQTLELAEDMEQTWMLGVLRAQCAAVPAARGDWRTAEEHIAAACEYAGTTGDLATAAYADDAAAFLATARGEPGAVATATARVRGAPETSPQREIGMFWWPVHLISALTDLDRLDEATQELAILDRRARPGGLRTTAARLRVAGQLAAARHDAGRARACFNQALAVPPEHVDVLERAMAHAAFGRFLRRRGERRSAIDQLRHARARYQSLGAVPFADRCDDELATCGVHDPTVATSDDILTPQERAVAALICSGKTNRQPHRSSCSASRRSAITSGTCTPSSTSTPVPSWSRRCSTGAEP